MSAQPDLTGQLHNLSGRLAELLHLTEAGRESRAAGKLRVLSRGESRGEHQYRQPG